MAKMSKGSGGALKPTIPMGKAPSGPKQSSGKVKHARMQVAAKVESNSNLPKVKC
jgi:hypothetical protein